MLFLRILFLFSNYYAIFLPELDFVVMFLKKCWCKTKTIVISHVTHMHLSHLSAHVIMLRGPVEATGKTHC